MRFAEKMLLNAKYFGLVAGMRHDGNGNRCALGLVEEGEPVDLFNRATHYAEMLFPWISELNFTTPCACILKEYPVNSCIGHIFNNHVMEDKTWTLERLADWIDSVDPTPRTPEVEAIDSIAIRDGEMVCR